MKIQYLKYLLLIFLFHFPLVISFQHAMAQNVNKIQEITVETDPEIFEGVKGTKTLIIKQSGLQVGSALSSENIAQAIRLLWRLEIFSDIQISQEKIEGGFRVVISVKILPFVNSVETEGFEEYKEEEILTAIKITRGFALGERKIAQLKEIIMDLYREKGFLAADVNFEVTPFSSDSTRVDVKISINEGRKIKVKSINIAGNQAISDKKLEKVMETKEDRWYRSGEFKEEVFEEDKKKIVALYHSEGYRDATVMRDSTYFDEKNEKMNLVLFVYEGPQYKFGKTTIDGNTYFTDEQLLEKMRYKEGDTYDQQEMYLSVFGYTDQNIEGIQTLYNDEGYLKTTINPIETVRGDSIDVFIDIAEGNISNVSRVDIEGNTKTIEKVIRREILLDPGMPFSRSKLDRSKREIMALNFFQDVTVDYEPHTDSDDVDIKYKVVEKQTGMASMGAGYSERDRLVGTLSFQNQNLFGNGQSIRFNWDMGTRRRSFQIGFGEPWLFNTPTSLSFDIYNIVRSDYTTAFDEEKRRGVSLLLGRRLDKWIDYSRATITYRLEDVDYSNASQYYMNYLITGKTSSLRFMFIRDSTDLPQFATEGATTAGTVEIAGGPLGGDLSYYKYLLYNEMYTPVFWNISFILRTRIGFLKGYKESKFVPYSERFMPGGTSWDGFVRGYPNRQVCPRLQGEEIGGETMFVNNLELQVPIVAQTLYGIAFYDFGNSWRNLSETNPFDVKRSVGIGARVFVPGVGNIGFDFGYGFDKLEGTDKVGGWRTHFQFGNMQSYY